MKTKLTLTIRKEIIEKAKRIAKRRRVSVSQLFEEAFQSEEEIKIKTKEQLSATQLLNKLANAKPVEQHELGDKELYRRHLGSKYA
ncbi:MAG: hypothetical protein JXQ90_04905 [Cyclobacteriaceae bacterium]